MLTNNYNDNNKITIEKVKDFKDGKYTHNKPVKLHCFYEKTTATVINSKLEEITTSGLYITKTKVKENDIIDGHTVIAVDEINAFGHKLYNAYV